MGVIPKMFSGLAVGAALALAAVCLLAALAAQGGRFSPRLDLLTHFAPFLLLGALLVLAYGATLAPAAYRSVFLLMAGLAIVSATALMLPEWTRPIRPPVAATAPHQLKIIQLNAWNENVDVPSTAAWIARQQPDLVLLEEMKPTLQAALVKQGFHYTRGMMRTGVFSRTAPIHAPFQIAEPDYHLLPPFARGTYDLDGAAFSILCTHLTWPTWNFQRTQIKALGALVARYDRRRLILVGDFNLTPWSFTLRRIDSGYGLERRDRALFTWPARLSPHGRLGMPLPLLPIDHVYAGAAWRTVKIERGPLLGSDHYPLVVVLALEN